MRSPTWDYFEKISLKKVKCLECGALVNSSGNTSNLFVHLKNHHNDIYEGIRMNSTFRGAAVPSLGADFNVPTASTSHFNTLSPGTHVGLPPREEATIAAPSSSFMSSRPAVESTSANSSAQESLSSGAQRRPPPGPSEHISIRTPRRPINAILQRGRRLPLNRSRESTNSGDDVPYDNNCDRMVQFRRILLFFIAIDMQPLSIVENRGFRMLINFLDPKIIIPSRFTLTRTLLPLIYQEMKAQLVEELSKINFVAITTDMWTSRTADSYITVTVHYINEFFLFSSKVLSTIELPENHTSLNIQNRLGQILKDWSLEGKVICAVTDNAANIVKAIKDMKLAHLPCFAHTLNLIVTGSLNAIPTIQSLIQKCRLLVKFFNKSSVANNKLAEQAEIAAKSNPNLTIRKLKQDVPTRWNSEVIMMTSISLLKEPILAVLAQMDKLELAITTDEWKVLDGIIEILVPFENVTTDLCAATYVSVSKVIPLVRNLKIHLAKLVVEEGSPTFQLRNNLHSELNRRFIRMEDDWAWGLGTFLDPRFKKLYIYHGIATIHGKIGDEINRLCPSIPPTLPAAASTSTATNLASSSEPAVNPRLPRNCLWDAHSASTVPQTGRNMLANNLIVIATYEAQSFQDIQEDPLEWWMQQVKHKELKQLIPVAKKVLCIPATSCPSEELFSKAGELISARRNRMSPTNVDMLLFLNKNC